MEFSSPTLSSQSDDETPTIPEENTNVEREDSLLIGVDNYTSETITNHNRGEGSVDPANLNFTDETLSDFLSVIFDFDEEQAPTPEVPVHDVRLFNQTRSPWSETETLILVGVIYEYQFINGGGEYVSMDVHHHYCRAVAEYYGRHARTPPRRTRVALSRRFRALKERRVNFFGLFEQYRQLGLTCCNLSN
mmetsp:Transcript_7236/g.8295  ORF Transcript_7236/g.8295 Transcript_7236/m.8295 type:complete len:191 (+) Transcript_7236:102-674(+)|eukprot:CAMPEP_0184040848 /NCGR_PEP_ID=MMETSP0955-20130417/60026_1 /TAXON_ID=627963 /ORGANISM="Aplanochytrium sp, Strain PBS07" /LENGTH=190 /DNA_ID=CAMNT_0026330875 /DNA_START=1306 /DNA_END=1878 /DNA_ORIENTATION=-